MPTITALSESIGDAVVITRRNLRKILRVPDVLVFTTLSPIMFVLLFAYVFGGAIGAQDTGVNYREYLIAGVFVQTVVFGATFTGYSLAEDLQRASSTGSAPCRCRRHRSSWAARSPTSASTS
jgi:hypothetical protein